MEIIRLLVAHMFSLWVLHDSSSFKLYAYIEACSNFKSTLIWHISMYTWNPNYPCFQWKMPPFGGSNPKIEDKQVPGMYIYIHYDIYIYIYTYIFLHTSTKKYKYIYMYIHVEACFNFGWIYRDLTWFAVKKPLTAFSPMNHRSAGPRRAQIRHGATVTVPAGPQRSSQVWLVVPSAE